MELQRERQGKNPWCAGTCLAVFPNLIVHLLPESLDSQAWTADLSSPCFASKPGTCSFKFWELILNWHLLVSQNSKLSTSGISRKPCMPFIIHWYQMGKGYTATSSNYCCRETSRADKEIWLLLEVREEIGRFQALEKFKLVQVSKAN